MQLRQCLSGILFILKFCGGLPPLKESKWFKLYYFCGVTFSLGFGGVFILSNFLNLFFSNEFDEIANSLYMSIEHSAALVKFYFLFYYTGLIRKMIDTLDSELFMIKTTNQKRYIDATTSTVRKNMLICYTIIVLCTMNYVISPILQGKHDLLPFPGYVPAIARSAPYFQIIYAWQSVVVPLGALLNISIDILITSFMVIACGQYDLLGDSFTNIYGIALTKCQKDRNWNIEVVNDMNETVDSYIYTELIVNVKHHLLIMAFIENIDKAFKWALFGQFSCSSLVLCLNIYYLSTMTGFDSQATALLSFTVVILMQLFLYCWYGNKIYFKSMDLSMAIYLSNWQKCNSKIRKSLCMVINRCQKPINITAGNFVPVRLETFINILKTAYSAYALLQNMGEDA